MASGMYEYGLQQILRGNIDLINDAVSVVLCSSDYTPNFSNDQNQIDIPEAARLGEVELDGNVLDGTTFKANSASIIDPTTDKQANAVVLFNDTDDLSTSQLIAYLEVTPFTTDGTNVVIDGDGYFTL